MLPNNSAINVSQPTLAPRTTTQNSILYMFGAASVFAPGIFAQELKLQTTGKTNPQIVLFGVTHGVPLSARHDLAEYSYFSRV